MGIDLDGSRRAVERLLDDELEVYRSAGGLGAEVLDEATGELHRSPGDLERVWRGSGSVVPLGKPAVTTPLGSSVVEVPPATGYQALLPVSAPELQADDVLVVVRSEREEGPCDPQLVGRRFRVSGTSVGSFTVVRVVRLQVID